MSTKQTVKVGKTSKPGDHGSNNPKKYKNTFDSSPETKNKHTVDLVQCTGIGKPYKENVVS